MEKNNLYKVSLNVVFTGKQSAPNREHTQDAAKIGLSHRVWFVPQLNRYDSVEYILYAPVNWVLFLNLLLLLLLVRPNLP